jgi:hypothetical protein
LKVPTKRRFGMAFNMDLNPRIDNAQDYID